MSNVVVPGQILASKFRVERVIGQGGMGVVVSAFHLELHERVALKFLLPEAMNQPNIVERFTREARNAVRIRSEHVARVTDVGRLENGAPYIVMEYLEGVDLGELVSQRGGLPVTDAADFVIQATEALAQAHVLGIVHRDIKPANLFLTRHPNGSALVKVLDFGISKAALTGSALSGNQVSLTQTSAAMGTPLYMSPEQMRSARDVDPRADIWALGCVLHELVAGSPVFMGESITELCAQVLQEPPRPLRSVVRDAPLGLQILILKCLEKNPSNRFQNVGELALALIPFASPNGQFIAQQTVSTLTANGFPVASPDAVIQGTVRMSDSAGSEARAQLRGPLAAAGQPAGFQHSPSAASTPPHQVQAAGPGTPFTTTNSWEEATRVLPSDVPTTSRAPLFVGIGLLGALVLAGVGYLVFRGKDETATAAAASSSSSQTSSTPRTEPVASTASTGAPTPGAPATTPPQTTSVRLPPPPPDKSATKLPKPPPKPGTKPGGTPDPGF